MLYLNFGRLEVKTTATVDAIRARVDAICAPLGKRVHAVVNYEGFVLDPVVADDYAAMVNHVVERWHSSVTRFTTSAFMRAKLGEALACRAVSSYIFETKEEALGRFGAPSAHR